MKIWKNGNHGHKIQIMKFQQKDGLEINMEEF